MTAGWFRLAEINGGPLALTIRNWIAANSKLAQGLAIFGVLFGVTAAVFIWAAFFRRRRRRRPHPHFPQPAAAAGLEPEAVPESRRKRRRRRAERRNPTLAETGGLPPVRPGETEPPRSPA